MSKINDHGEGIYKKLVTVCSVLLGISALMCFAKPIGMFIIGVTATSVLLVAVVIFAVLMHRAQKKVQADVDAAYAESVGDYVERLKRINADMADLTADDCGEEGRVSFLNEGITFSAEGKYVIAENFNGKAGVHFAVKINGIELVRKPDGYDDVLDYESSMFQINIGYFEDCALSLPENDNGVMLDSATELEGKTVKLNADEGYVFDIDTIETDPIDSGEIQFVEWNESRRVIFFKLVVGSGVADVVYGKVVLQLDPDFNDKI